MKGRTRESGLSRFIQLRSNLMVAVTVGENYNTLTYAMYQGKPKKRIAVPAYLYGKHDQPPLQPRAHR